MFNSTVYQSNKTNERNNRITIALIKNIKHRFSERYFSDRYFFLDSWSRQLEWKVDRGQEGLGLVG